jgi:hypothetical protein
LIRRTGQSDSIIALSQCGKEFCNTFGGKANIAQAESNVLSRGETGVLQPAQAPASYAGPYVAIIFPLDGVLRSAGCILTNIKSYLGCERIFLRKHPRTIFSAQTQMKLVPPRKL